MVSPSKEPFNDLEYSSLREEILKWQDRRIIFSQITITLVTAYTGYIISQDINKSLLYWQTTSIFPLLLLSITMHISKLFETFQIRITAFLAVFYDSYWEKNVGKKQVSMSTGRWTVGYNKSMAIVYLIIGLASVILLFQKYPNSTYSIQTTYFICFAAIFLINFFILFNFKTTDKKNDLMKNWRDIKKENENPTEQENQTD